MGFANRAFGAAGVGFAVLALAGCGSSGGLLTQGQASRLKSQLTAASDALDAGDCQGAAEAARRLLADASNLGGVDSRLSGNLVRGANEIVRATRRQCPVVSPHPGPRHRPPPTPTTDTTVTMPTTPTATNTTPTITTSTLTTPTIPAPVTTAGGGSPLPGQTTATTTSTPTTPATTTTSTTSTSGGSSLGGPTGPQGSQGGENQQ